MEHASAAGWPAGPTTRWRARYPVTFAPVKGSAVDWDALRAAAADAAKWAYVPYSGYPVGAAGLVDNGRVITGCNVENASYGLSLCAECGLVSALHGTGEIGRAHV